MSLLDKIIKPNKSSTSLSKVKLTEFQLLLIIQGVVIVYIAYSFISTGFYQHDEVGNYLAMRSFWFDPNSILGVWQKPGHKLIYVLPSLLGEGGVFVLNVYLAAFTGYFSYKCAEHSGAKAPVIAFLLLVLQPLWVEISFRNYSEILSAFLLITTVFFHQKKKFITVALILSYCTLVRQEFFILGFAYAVFLLYRKEIWAVLILPVFPLLHNLWGYFATGDWLYLLHAVFNTSSSYQEAYLRQGFDHYFLMSVTIFGALSLTFFIVYLAVCIVKKEKPEWIYLAPFTIYFLLHAVFNLQSIDLGPSTSGNLRYMIVIAPLVAVMGNLGIEQILKIEDRRKLLFILLPFVITVGVFMTYDHNYIKFTTQRNWAPLIMTIISVASIWVFTHIRQAVYFSLIGGILVCVLTLKPIKISEEDNLIKYVAQWTQNNGIEGRHILVQHPMYFYYYGKVRQGFNNGTSSLTKEDIEKAQPGSVIIWDNHYSYRKGQEERYVLPNYFLEKPEEFKYVERFSTNDDRYFVYIFEKKSS